MSTALCGYCAHILFLIALMWATSHAGPRDNPRRPDRQRSATGDKQAAASTYGAPSCTPGTPRFPNYLQPVAIDPLRISGKWYDYKLWSLSKGVSLGNSVMVYTNLLNGTLTTFPGSNTKGVVLEQLNSFIDPTTYQCQTVQFLSYLSAEGQFMTTYFGSSKFIALDFSHLLAIDYDNYLVLYVCYTHDSSSGLCVDPNVLVQTRVRPDQVSDTLASTISNVTNQLLSRHCFDAGLFRNLMWQGGDAAECPLVRSTDDCYTSLRNAYLYQSDPNFSDTVTA